MTHDQILCVSVLLLYVLGTITQLQLRYIHKRINMLAHRRAAVRRSLASRSVVRGLGLVESMRRHPAGSKLRAVK